ncbi:MAG: hypothetical protein VZR95_09445 [Alphaproteobacteria bacterium]
MEKDKSKPEFLYAGDIWSALWGNDYTKPLAYTISHAVAKSDMTFTTNEYSFWEYKPFRSMFMFNSIMKHEENANLFLSIYPFCKGVENELSFCDVLESSEDNTEGYVLLQKNNAVPMWMFNPLYLKQQKQLLQHLDEHNERQKFMIFGIGWDIIKTPPRSIKIYEGKNDYKVALQEFLRANPDKSEDDFPLIKTADASHMNFIGVMQCDDAYEFSSDIYSISEFKYHGTMFYCLEIAVLRYSGEHAEDEKGLRLKLYANKELLGAYKPQIGDNISGIMQLNAYLCD